MPLCPREKCQWYGEAKPGGRSCYYGEPRCWKGWLGIIIGIFKMSFRYKLRL